MPHTPHTPHTDTPPSVPPVAQPASQPPPDNSRWLGMCIGMAILGYLLPWHSPIGRDFLVNSWSVAWIVLGLMAFWWTHRLRHVGLSVVTWLGLAGWIGVQSLIVDIRYPHALMFPIGGLLIVAWVGAAASNVTDKARLLTRVFGAAFVMAVLTFAIQIMQILHYQIVWQGWIIARSTANPTRFDGNFGQANHTAYAFVLALCGVLYLLQQAFGDGQLFGKRVATWRYRQVYRVALMLGFVAFSIGLALTQSRAGLGMAVIVAVVFFAVQPLAWRRKAALVGGTLAVFLLYYVAASWLSSLGQANELGAVSRLAGGQGNRAAMHARGLMMFAEHPLTGVGWNNYMGASIDYAQAFAWPEIADHTHNFVSMLLAELGVIGLAWCLPIVWVLLRALHTRHSRESAAALAFVWASILYASVEYPLWYVRYLAVFALFVALIDQRQYALRLPANVGISAGAIGRRGLVCALAAVLGVLGYYVQTFLARNYLDYSQFVRHENHKFTDQSVPPYRQIWGFEPYEERIFAMRVPVNAVNIADKTRLFYNVMGLDSSQFNMLAYAQMLAYQGDTTSALRYVQAACVMVRDRKNCDNIDIDLGNLAQQNPAVFGALYQDFVAWRKANPAKTGLTPR